MADGLIPRGQCAKQARTKQVHAEQARATKPN